MTDEPVTAQDYQQAIDDLRSRGIWYDEDRRLERLLEHALTLRQQLDERTRERNVAFASLVETETAKRGAELERDEARTLYHAQAEDLRETEDRAMAMEDRAKGAERQVAELTAQIATDRAEWLANRLQWIERAEQAESALATMTAQLARVKHYAEQFDNEQVIALLDPPTETP